MTALMCKNCGAPLTGSKCEYCGTSYINVEKATPVYDANGAYMCSLSAHPIMSPNELRHALGLSTIQDATVTLYENAIKAMRDYAGLDY